MTSFFSWNRKGVMRRSALRQLFNMDATQLNDLGLTRFDIAEAMRSGGTAGELLAARRDARAQAWLR